ncbi:MAG TPA: helicase HerA-like domain-containing protein, partial [Burkholderiales bacterium]|nr:helicase HerA-like domain-containing protein [Burkholderiales bacterium]
TTMRANPKLDVEKAITELGVGEALVSLLDEKGRPGIVERAFIVPPSSKIGPITPAEREAAIKQSGLHGTYEQAVDRESAYEKLKQATEAKQAQQPAQQAPQRQTIFKQEPAAPAGTAETQGGWGELLGSVLTGKGSRRQGVLESMAKSAARTVGTEVGRRVMRGVLGSILGGGRR